ncbi:MAG: hypothetical protein JSC189_000392 [Candidatus Tokpelaia sp. JSC189]|nr:MAG: hypothetical protein JSC189_000392 [Candidatus Tokpelaia sp. JSC189]
MMGSLCNQLRKTVDKISTSMNWIRISELLHHRLNPFKLERHPEPLGQILDLISGFVKSQLIILWHKDAKARKIFIY